MKLQKLYLIRFNLILLSVLLTQDTQFNGILEQKLLLYKRVLQQKMDIPILFIHQQWLVHKMLIILFQLVMIANYACGILENLVIQKLVLICSIKDKVHKEIKRCFILIQWSFQRRKLISSSQVQKIIISIKQMLINRSITLDKLNSKVIGNFLAIVHL